MYVLTTFTFTRLTFSLAIQKALEDLGFGPCYHMRNCINQNPRDCRMWVEALEARYDGIGSFGIEQWDQLLGNFSVPVTGSPSVEIFAYLAIVRMRLTCHSLQPGVNGSISICQNHPYKPPSR